MYDPFTTCARRFLYGDQARFFGDEIHLDVKHSKIGTVAMASAGENLNASQVWFPWHLYFLTIDNFLTATWWIDDHLVVRMFILMLPVVLFFSVLHHTAWRSWLPRWQTYSEFSNLPPHIWSIIMWSFGRRIFIKSNKNHICIQNPQSHHTNANPRSKEENRNRRPKQKLLGHYQCYPGEARQLLATVGSAGRA